MECWEEKDKNAQLDVRTLHGLCNDQANMSLWSNESDMAAAQTFHNSKKNYLKAFVGRSREYVIRRAQF